MGIIKFILYSRYRPLNLVETIFVSFLNLFYTKNSKHVSFHIFRLKRKPASTVYYNNLGRILLYIINLLSILIFNKIFLKGVTFLKDLKNEIHNQKKFGDDFSHWPRIKKEKQLVPNNEQLNKEIENRCNTLISTLIEEKKENVFWSQDRKKFRELYLKKDNKINFDLIKNFRSDEKLFQSFNSLIFKNESFGKLGRKDKIRCLNLIIQYHKVAEKSKIDLLLNCSDNNLGNPNFLVYRNQIINERLLRQVYFGSQVIRLTSLEILKKNIFLEIGPGYGLLPRLLKNNFKNSKFILIDLPEVNILSYYYLQNSFPKAKIFCSNDLINQKKIDVELIDKYDFFILRMQDLKKIENNVVDCTINIASLGEMHNDTQSFYINQIERVTNNYFYSVNRFRRDNKLFKELNGYYEFKLNEVWDKVFYDFSPTLHIETMLKKNDD